jgi:hypothetical protein
MNIRNMTPSDLAEYIGPWCDDSIASSMLERLQAAEYETVSEVPDATWDQMLQHSVRECEQAA